jgi:hypothetical protein
MELHQNDKKICDIIGVARSSDKKCAFQDGRLAPIEQIDLLSMYIPTKIKVGLGDKFMIVDGDFKMSIGVWSVTQLEDGYEVKIEVIKKAAV